MNCAEANQLHVIEDVAQAIGSNYHFANGQVKKAGTIGHVAGTSFFPSKNLGCYGDGGAMITTDPRMAERLKIIANHGQTALYMHRSYRCEFTFDSIQAAVLKVKLAYLEEYIEARRSCRKLYG